MADVEDLDEVSETTKKLLDEAEESEKPEDKPAEKTPEGDNPTDEDKPAPRESALLSELEALQEQNREQAKTIATMEKTLARLNDVLVKAKLIEEENPEERAAADAAENARNQQLETMLELMELNPQYQDVKQVVTRKRFDDIVEQLARVKVTKEGGRLVDAVGSIEDEIWGMTNPYKYMYGKIKEFHPDYQKKKDDDAPTDIHDIPGGKNPKDGGAWTAAKIDALGEDELDQVPADIYQKYLRNELK